MEPVITVAILLGVDALQLNPAESTVDEVIVRNLRSHKSNLDLDQVLNFSPAVASRILELSALKPSGESELSTDTTDSEFDSETDNQSSTNAATGGAEGAEANDNSATESTDATGSDAGSETVAESTAEAAPANSLPQPTSPAVPPKPPLGSPKRR